MIHMERPCYRWKSFWLGVLVLVFLAWAVLDSYSHETDIRPLGENVVVVHQLGEVRVYWLRSGLKNIFGTPSPKDS